MRSECRHTKQLMSLTKLYFAIRMLKVHRHDIYDNNVKKSLLRVDIHIYVCINGARGDIYGDTLKIHPKG